MTPQEALNRIEEAFIVLRNTQDELNKIKDQLANIKATLIVNFGPSGKVTTLLTQYQIDTKTVHWLMFACLEYMYNEVSKLRKEPTIQSNHNHPRRKRTRGINGGANK